MKRLAGELAPYFALWRPLLRLARGTWALAKRLFDVCMAGEGWEKLWRALGAVIAASVVYGTAEQQPLVMVPVTFAWLWFAWKAGPAPAATEKPADGDDQEQQEPEPEAPLPDREQLTHALHEVAAPHAHLAALATHLDCPPARVREALTEAGIPIAGGVRAGARVSTGVRKQDFPPLSPTPLAPSEPVVVAGQATTTTDQGPTEQGPIVERPHPGMLIIRDRAETALRHHTVRRP